MRVLIVVAALLAMGGVGRAQGGCELKKDVYTCNGAEFSAEWKAAKTVSVQVRSVNGVADAMAGTQLRQMLEKMGKTVAADGAAADLVVTIVQRDTEGVYVGPAGIELGSLRVYMAGADGAKGNLVWAESMVGQPDVPWGAVVHMVVGQFEGRFGKLR